MTNRPTLPCRFVHQQHGAIILWTADPEEAAHQTLLEWLQICCSEFLPTTATLTTRLKGNLGESIAVHVGLYHSFTDAHYRVYPANAWKPLSAISYADLDIVWLYFGESPSEDFAILQEVKTTSDTTLSISSELASDYSKLFGTDLNLTVRSRLDKVRCTLHLTEKQPSLAKRVNALAGKSPATSPRLHLLPTLVHERRNCEPLEKLLAVRTNLLGQEWTPSNIRCCSIALTDLDDRLLRLATGRA